VIFELLLVAGSKGRYLRATPLWHAGLVTGVVDIASEGTRRALPMDEEIVTRVARRKIASAKLDEDNVMIRAWHRLVAQRNSIGTSLLSKLIPITPIDFVAPVVLAIAAFGGDARFG